MINNNKQIINIVTIVAAIIQIHTDTDNLLTQETNVDKYDKLNSNGNCIQKKKKKIQINDTPVNKRTFKTSKLHCNGNFLPHNQYADLFVGRSSKLRQCAGD